MFDSLFADVEKGTHQFTVHRRDEQTAIESWLADHGISVDSKRLPLGAPDPFIEITTDDEFVCVIGLEELEVLLEPPIVRPTDGSVSAGYRVIFDTFDDTNFTSLNRRELLAVSREIEDRAYRVGRGTLRVSFQTLSTFSSQIDLYQELAAETALDIHIYGTPDWSPPDSHRITYHEDQTGSIAPYWILAFDGGLDETQMCALIAKEQADGYQGWWTNEPDTVDEILMALEIL